MNVHDVMKRRGGILRLGIVGLALAVGACVWVWAQRERGPGREEAVRLAGAAFSEGQFAAAETLLRPFAGEVQGQESPARALQEAAGA